jgi:RNA 3'-terminal phosphate cyclase-like protein
MQTKKQFKTFYGHNFFRQRLALSILSQTPIKIIEIRINSESPGLQEHEASLLRLIEKITTGTTTSINHTGTAITFIPGYIHGGKLEHQCGGKKSIGYFIEFLLSVGAFGKETLMCQLMGVTNDNTDTSVDLIRTSLLPQLTKFGIENISLKVCNY